MSRMGAVRRSLALLRRSARGWLASLVSGGLSGSRAKHAYYVLFAVSVLEAKRLGHRAVLRLSWLLLVASVALPTLLRVAVTPPILVGYLTAGATPVWLLGSFAVLSLLYRTPVPAEPAADVEDQAAAGESKRERARQAYAALVAAGQPVTGARLAEAAGVSASYGRALLSKFQADPALAVTATASGPARRRVGRDRDHLADLPQLWQLLRAA